MSAFADRGLQLVPYRRHGAITTYRSSRGGATLYVNVCSTNCSPDDRWITRRPRNVGPVVFVRNLGMAVAGPRAAAAPLRGAVLAVADEFDGPNGGERCYIG